MFALKEGAATTRPASGSEEVGIHHIAFTVDDVDKFCENLKREGVEITMEPKGSWAGRRIAFFTDPDGIILQPVQNPWLI